MSLIRWSTASLRALPSSRSLVRFASNSSGARPPVSSAGPPPPHLLTLADLSVAQTQRLVSSAMAFKRQIKSTGPAEVAGASVPLALDSLQRKTVALMFNKRSTRTRVASESAVAILGKDLFLCGSSNKPDQLTGPPWGQGVMPCFSVRETSNWASTRACTTLRA